MNAHDTERTEILPFRSSDAEEAFGLWREYAKRCAALSDIAAKWENLEPIREFLIGHGEANLGMVLRQNGVMRAYAAYDRFLFHREDSAFLPIVGHARMPGSSARAFEKLYRALAEKLVGDGCITHFLTCAAEDAELQRIAFRLGFGLYVVDATRSSGAESALPAPPGSFCIRSATPRDVDELHELVLALARHLGGSPLFLCREAETQDQIAQAVSSDSGAVIVADTDGEIAGFMSVRVAPENSPITMMYKGMGAIEPLGAYVRPEFRSRGIGAALVREVSAWCRERNVSEIHVDFESANLEATAFWLQHFHPTLYSVKRRVNQDILG